MLAALFWQSPFGWIPRKRETKKMREWGIRDKEMTYISIGLAGLEF